MIFSPVLSLLYLDTYRNSEADNFEQPASLYRNILDLAHDIKRIIGDDGGALPAGELNERIEDDCIK